MAENDFFVSLLFTRASKYSDIRNRFQFGTQNRIIRVIRISGLFGSADLNLDPNLNSDSDLNLTPDLDP